MLHYLLSPYITDFPTLRLINYISFRAAGAAVTSLLVAFIVGAILTPPDPISQMMLAIPIILLYEISIWLVWLMVVITLAGVT